MAPNSTQTEDIEQRRTLLTFAVLGAGRSGVELAATLADLLPDWYAQIGGNKQEIRVVIILYPCLVSCVCVAAISNR